MSVAFRRESDEEHLEPKFAVPIPPGRNLVTAHGKALIDARVTALEQAVAKTTDDAAIATAKRDLRYWQTRQVTAEQPPLPVVNSVEFGVTVTFALGGETRSLQLVGSDEAASEANRLAFTAPLARALMGSEPGDLLPFAGREDAIEILAVTGEPLS